MEIYRFEHPKFNELWEKLNSDVEFAPPFCSKLDKEYQSEYYKGKEFKDISIVIYDNNSPLAGISGSISLLNDGSFELTNFGRPFFLHINPKYNSNKVHKEIVQYINSIISKYKVRKIHYLDLLFQGDQSEISHFLLERNASLNVRFTRILDLLKSENELHSQVRKSYKSLINWGEKNLNLQIFDSSNISIDDIYKMRDLHISVSGKETRNIRTWEIQYEMIKNNQAFAITGKLEDKLVTFGFFMYSQHYCYYGSSASIRELFDKPLSHSIIWNAILFAKKLGCKYFETGDYYYNNRNVTEKEIDISKFKRGFGGMTKVQLNVDWKR